jgi:hypothetical protein
MIRKKIKRCKPVRLRGISKAGRAGFATGLNMKCREEESS